MSECKFFGTDGIRGRVGLNPITPEFILKLGWAAGRVFAREAGSKVLIGKDTRISGYLFESALEAGLSAAGVNIQLLGPMPTPAIAYLTRTLRAQAGIVISASHNAYHDNGIKFFSEHGTKLPDELELAIEAELEKPLVTVDSALLGKAARVNDAPGRYIEFCKSTISFSTDLTGLKIVVDCANGATYHIAGDVFRELGAEVVELGVDPDGLNINAGCGSTRPDILQKIVTNEEADVGIALDGDGDRVVMVDNRGVVVDGDELVYIIAQESRRQKLFQGGVVGTQMSNLGLELALEEMGVEYVRTKVGDRYVLAELEKRHWWLGGEPSGHIIWRRVQTTGDGIVAALQVLAAMVHSGKPLTELKTGMQKFPQVLINVEVKNTIKPIEHPDIQKAQIAIEKALGKRGRVVLRPSGTEPVIRVMVEGEDPVHVQELAKELAEKVARVC